MATTGRTPSILIADDDPAMVALLQEAFDQYPTCFAADGAAILYQLTHEQPDMVLLDLVLPDVDGLVLIREIRNLSPVPVIVLSGRAGQSDRVLALRAGADDFIAKPFDLDDLEARVEAVLRRSTREAAEPREPLLQLGPLTISNWSGARVNGKTLVLSPTEHKLLMGLVKRAPEVVTRDELAESVWGGSSPDAGQARLVTVYVGRLRGRLRLSTHSPEIVTPRSQGYAIRE